MISPRWLITGLILATALGLSSGLLSVKGSQETTSAIDFRWEVRYFGGVPTGFPWPNHRLLEEPVNSQILNAALRGVTRSEVEGAGIRDAESRLDALVKGQCLMRDGDVYRVPFPVISGEARKEISRDRIEATSPS